ncbi:MFS transporter [Brucella tritici]|uniref:MFS transporter n=1 Tax=Brucella tritici TaxID=94626 RepID=A0A6L3YC85_9HYPH|nr:MFS transporter [Brucella tritici]KAB2676375.1 MFS transporter [Brucella tritici]
MTGLLMIGSVARSDTIAPLIVRPGPLALIGLLFIASGAIAPVAVGLLLLWGICAKPLMATGNTWMNAMIPNDVDAGGGLQVGVIQCSIASVTFLGGMVLHHVARWSVFLLTRSCSWDRWFQRLPSLRNLAASDPSR